MPFHPLPESGPSKPVGSDFGLLATRLIVAIAFLYYQLAGQLRSLLRFVWDREEWALVERFRDFDLPFPQLLAPAVILVFTVALNPQSLVLYLAVFLGLAIGGAGRVSLDHLFASRKARNKRGF